MDFLSEVQRAEASYRESGRPPTGPPPIPLPADTAVALPPEANGRRTRWTINQSSLQTLEAIFQHEQFPSQQLRTQLGAHLGVSPRQVQVWFQNRRQRERKEGAATAAAAAGYIDPAALPAAPAAASAPEYRGLAAPALAAAAAASSAFAPTCGGSSATAALVAAAAQHLAATSHGMPTLPTQPSAASSSADADADAVPGPLPLKRSLPSIAAEQPRVYDPGAELAAAAAAAAARAAAQAQAQAQLAAAAAAAAQAAETPEEDEAATEAATAAAMSAAAATVAALAAAAPASSSTDSLAPTTSLEGDASTDSTRLSKRMQLSHDQRAVLEAVVSAPPASSRTSPSPMPTTVRPHPPRSQFVNERTPDAQLRVDLGAYLQLTPRQVQVWFQNRRQREKSANPGDAAPAGRRRREPTSRRRCRAG